MDFVVREGGEVRFGIGIRNSKKNERVVGRVVLQEGWRMARGRTASQFFRVGHFRYNLESL